MELRAAQQDRTALNKDFDPPYFEREHTPTQTTGVHPYGVHSRDVTIKSNHCAQWILGYERQVQEAKQSDQAKLQGMS